MGGDVMAGQNYNRRNIDRFAFNPGVRLQNPDTLEYLHEFGAGVTKDENRSWRGYKAQAATLQERAETRGEPWPFVPVSPNDERSKKDVW